MNETPAVGQCLPSTPCELLDQGLQPTDDRWDTLVPEPSLWLRALHRLRIHRVVWLYGFLLELRNLFYRIGQLRKTNLYRTGLDIGPAFETTQGESVRECTRTHACTRDMQNLYAMRPWVTILDVELFLAGWKQGSAWECSHADTEKHDRSTVSSAGPSGAKLYPSAESRGCSNV